METRKVARAIILVAIGVAISPFTSIPIGIARINPAQHFVNVVGAVLLGPWWATGIALVIGILRNALGTGTLLAFPGGMIGAFIAGLAYRYTTKYLSWSPWRNHRHRNPWGRCECSDRCAGIYGQGHGHGCSDDRLLRKHDPWFNHWNPRPQAS